MISPRAADARLRKLERRRKVQSADADAFGPNQVAWILDCARHDRLRYEAGAGWIATVDYAQSAANWLNELRAEQPDAVLVAIMRSEATKALQAWDAGRLALATKTYQPHVAGPPLDPRTGTPILTVADEKRDWVELGALVRNVQTACVLLHQQLGVEMPLELVEFRDWLDVLLVPWAIPDEQVLLVKQSA